jgi:rifampin ADP-ribosylating transferase
MFSVATVSKAHVTAQNVTSTQNMEFNPNNRIVQLCLQGMELESEGNREEAGKCFLRAWNEATNDFEKYLAAFYLARQQTDVSAKLKWFETALLLALKTNDHSTNSALPSIESSRGKIIN